MNIPLELFDWIAPGEILYCKCGNYLVDPENDSLCDNCRTNLPIEDFICGICGKQASMMFVHGYRCKDHAFIKKPSQAIIKENIICTSGQFLKSPPPRPKGKLPTVEDHSIRVKSITEVATKRKNSGVSAKFWLKKTEPNQSAEPLSKSATEKN